MCAVYVFNVVPVCGMTDSGLTYEYIRVGHNFHIYKRASIARQLRAEI